MLMKIKSNYFEGEKGRLFCVNVFMYANRVIIPESLQCKVFRRFHADHPGIFADEIFNAKLRALGKNGLRL